LNSAGYTAEIAPGARSQFDVVADGKTVFSKQRAGHFPELAEVLAALPAP
jgi:predicted Rdx family selenoprotein